MDILRRADLVVLAGPVSPATVAAMTLLSVAGCSGDGGGSGQLQDVRHGVAHEIRAVAARRCTGRGCRDPRRK